MLTKTPCHIPIPAEMIKVTRMAPNTPKPCAVNHATKTDVRTTTEPGDKSMPAVMITKVSPMAIKLNIAICLDKI